MKAIYVNHSFKLFSFVDLHQTDRQNPLLGLNSLHAYAHFAWGITYIHLLLNHFPSMFQIIQVNQPVILAVVVLSGQWAPHSPQYRLRVFIWIPILHTQVWKLRIL